MRLFLLILAGLFLGMPSAADELKYKSVKPAKYMTGEPAKGFKFLREAPLADLESAPVADHLRKVVYWIEDGTGRRIEGVLDLSGDTPKWAVEPRFKGVYAVNEHFSLAKPRLDGPYFICKHGAKTCSEGKKHLGRFKALGSDSADKAGAASESDAPYWLAPIMLGDWAVYDTANMTLYSPQGDPIGTLDNVAMEAESYSHYMQAVKMGDTAIVRVRDESRMTSSSNFENRETYDVALTYLGGEITQTRVPAFSIIHAAWSLPGPNGDYRTKTKEIRDYRYLFNGEPGEDLYFPVYPEGAGFRTAPADLVGIHPVRRKDLKATHWRKYARDYSTITANDAEFFGPDLVSAWIARWATPDGMRWAFIRTDEIFPSYDEIIASRTNAAYTSYQPLWDTSLDDAKIARQTGLLDRFAFFREDGRIDIYSVGAWRENLWPYVAVTTQLAARGLEAYLSRELAADKAYIAEAKRRYDEVLAWEAANKAASEQAWAEYNARARQREQEADARRAEQNRQAQLYWEEQERAAIANQQRLAEQFAPDPSVAFWGAFSNSVQSSSPGTTSSAPIDYWKSYDSTNTTGQYTTSSGAATGCRLGSGAC